VLRETGSPEDTASGGSVSVSFADRGAYPEEDAPALRVMVCDDHRVVAQGLAGMVERQSDMTVVGMAHSMAGALEMAAAHDPDVVLMDYRLPDGDGVSATQALKAANPQVKVVLLTSFTDETVLLAAMEAGCSGFVTKHQGGEEVVRAVRLAAAGEAVVSADMLSRLLPRLSPQTRGVGQGGGRQGRSPGWDLTARELEVLQLLAEGASTPAIAERLVLATNTVRNHIQNIFSKLEVHSRLEAVTTAARAGLIRGAAGLSLSEVEPQRTAGPTMRGAQPQRRGAPGTPGYPTRPPGRPTS
jgi:DNA-binding NarL/FixJ family response regulator